MGDPRLPYLMIMFLMIILSAVLRYWNKPIAFHLYTYDFGCTSNKCYGTDAVYRVMFASFIFFSFFGIAMKIGSCAKSSLDRSWWVTKLIMLIGLLVIGYLVPPQVIEAYRYISIIISAIFLVIQIVLLVDFAYSWNEAWLAKEMKCAMLSVSLLGYLVSLAALILLFHFYNNDEIDGCYAKSYLSLTLIATLGFTLLSMTEWSQHGAILPSAVVTVYCYWIAYSALSEGPCNIHKRNDTASVVVGFLLLAFSVVYSGWSVSRKTQQLTTQNAESNLLEEEDKEDYQAVTPNEAGTDSALEDVQTQDDGSAAPSNPSSFHFIMAASCCYAAMLLTSWGAKPDDAHVTPEITVQWIKMASQWVCMLLYTWSLMAPYILTNRSF